MFLDVPQVGSSLVSEDRDLQSAEDREHFALRAQRAAKAHQVGTEGMEPRDALPTRLLDDVLLELVEDRLEPVELREIGVDDCIEDRICEEVRAGLHHLGILLSKADPDVFQLRESLFVDRDQELLRDEQGQRIGVDLLRPRDRPSDDEHDIVIHVHLRRHRLVPGVVEGERVGTEEGL